MVNIQPAFSMTVKGAENTAVLGQGAMLVNAAYNPMSSAITAGSYMSPSIVTTTGNPIYSSTSSTGIPSAFPAANIGWTGDTNNSVVTHGETEGYQNSYASSSTTNENFIRTSTLLNSSIKDSRLYQTDPGSLNPPDAVTAAR